MSKMVINNEKSESTKKPVGVKIHTKTITLEQEFMCAPPQLYRVFTDKEVGVVWMSVQLHVLRSLGIEPVHY